MARKKPDDDVLVLEEDDLVEDGGRKDQDSDSFTKNLVGVLPEDILTELGVRYVEYANKDLEDREQHFERYAEGLERTGLTQDPPKGPAFEGGTDIIYPILTEAAIDFQSATIEELFPATGPVRINPSLQASPHKIRLAQKKAEFLNRTIIQDMPEYRSELEKLLSQVPLAGNAYRKFWWDKRYKRVRCDFYPVDRVLLPFNAASFYNASRITLVDELSVSELRQRFRTKLYAEDIEVDDSDQPMDKYRSMAAKVNESIEDKLDSSGASSEGYRTVFEVYCDIDLPEDPEFKKEWGYAPYILTLDVETQKPLALYRNWSQDDETGARKNYLSEWGLMPWRGIYSIGLFHIAGPLAGLLSGLLRGMVDNVQITNMPAALAMYRAGLQGQNIQINAGQITPIELNAVRDIREAIMPVPFNQMSPIVLELFKFLDTSTRGLLQTSLDRIGLDDTTVPVGTQMARIEQGLKVYKAVFARLHESQRRELDIICRLYSDHMETIYCKDDDDKVMTDAEGKKEVYLEPDDFGISYDLMPASDPSIFSEAQRMARWAIVDQAVQLHPEIFDVKTYYKIRFERMGIPNVDQFIPDDIPAPNDNPATENVKMAMKQPVVVNPDQDHIAHIAVHVRAMGDPVIGDSTLFNMTFQPMAITHIKQHVLMRYMELSLDMVNKKLGGDVTKMNTKNIQVANKIAEALAQVHDKVEETMYKELAPIVQELEKIQTGLSQILQAPPPVDPNQQLVQVQATEVQNKMAVDNANVQLKTAKQEVEAKFKEKELELRDRKLSLDEMVAQMEDQNKKDELALKDKSSSQDNRTQVALQMHHDITQALAPQQGPPNV